MDAGRQRFGGLKGPPEHAGKLLLAIGFGQQKNAGIKPAMR